MKKMLIIFFSASLGFLCFPAYGAWQCNVVNPVKNQTWIGTGPTRAIAIENAIRFCSNNSVYVKNCNITGCAKK